MAYPSNRVLLTQGCKHPSTGEVFVYYLYYLYYYYLYYLEISSHAGVQTSVYWRRRKKHETFQNIYKRPIKVMRQNIYKSFSEIPRVAKDIWEFRWHLEIKCFHSQIFLFENPRINFTYFLLLIFSVLFQFFVVVAWPASVA